METTASTLERGPGSSSAVGDDPARGLKGALPESSSVAPLAYVDPSDSARLRGHGPMNNYLVAAAALSAVGAVLHSVLGERLILSRLQPDALPQTLGSKAFTLRVLRLFWHLVSVAWWGFAALLVVMAFAPRDDDRQRLLAVIALSFVASAAVSAVISRGRHFSWGVLLAIAALSWLGMR